MKSGMLLRCILDYVKEHMDKIIEFSELGDFIDRPLRTYSGEMYSKLSFAVTAILDTDIMLVDEVLSVGGDDYRWSFFEERKFYGSRKAHNRCNATKISKRSMNTRLQIV